MMRTTSLVLLAAATLAAGCTTSLVSTKLDKNTTTAANGLIYRLPMKQFDLAVTYELFECVPQGNQVKLGAKVSGNLTETVLGDDEQTYFLDYNKLAERMKVSRVEIGVSDTGLLSSINSSVKDQTGPVITNTATAAFSVARAVLLSGAPVPVPMKTVPLSVTSLDYSQMFSIDLSGSTKSETRNVTGANDLCTKFKKAKDAYDEALKNSRSAASVVKQRAAALDALAKRQAIHDQLEKEQEYYKQYGTPAQWNAAVEVSKVSKKALDNARLEAAAMEAADKDLEKANKALAEARAKVVIEYPMSFSPTLKEYSDTQGLLYSSINTLFDTSVRPCDKNYQTNCVALPTVTLTVTPVGGSASPDIVFKDGKAGVVYRVPATARLEAKTEGEVVFLNQLTQVPQYGHIASLDLENGAFADNMLKVTFNSNGVPTQLSFSSESQAEAASKAAAQTAQSYFDFAKGKQQDKIDAAKTQISLDKDRAAANASVATDNLSTLRDIQKLQALANGSSTAAATQLDALNNQRDLLEAQLKILALQKQINEAKAGLATTAGQ